MKSPSFSILLTLIALSDVGAFAHNSGRSFSASRKHLTNNQYFKRGGAEAQMKREDAARKEPLFRYTSFSEVNASISSGDATEKENTLLQSVSSAPLTKSFLSSALFVLMDLCIKNILKTNGISFPSSVAGLCSLAMILLVSPFHTSLYRVLNPGAKLMQKFMMIFLVPNLIVLPLCEGSYSVYEVSRHYNGLLFDYLME